MAHPILNLRAIQRVSEANTSEKIGSISREVIYGCSFRRNYRFNLRVVLA